jgi:hypothetical protein
MKVLYALTMPSVNARPLMFGQNGFCDNFARTVYPENPIGIEIIEPVGVGSSDHARNVAVVYSVLSPVSAPKPTSLASESTNTNRHSQLAIHAVVSVTIVG